MAGLAIGNLIAPKFLRRFEQPLQLYAALEITIALCGLILVFALPYFSSFLAPIFRPLLDSPLLNVARLILAFVLLVIPAIGMGVTLPTVVSALSQHDPNFGRILGLLYGSNTMGAVVGAIAGELLLIRIFGVRGTGIVAAMCSMSAAILALRLGGGQPPSAVRTAEGRCPPHAAATKPSPPARSRRRLPRPASIRKANGTRCRRRSDRPTATWKSPPPTR